MEMSCFLAKNDDIIDIYIQTLFSQIICYNWVEFIPERKIAMYEIAVCDDCKMDRERLINHINNKDNPYELRIHEYGSGEELLSAMKSIRFAVIFLDVQMKKMDGEETAIRIRCLDNNLVLAFYTGFVEPSPKTLEVQPYRYIMKNMSENQVARYVKDVLERMRIIYSTPQLVANLYRKQIVIDPRHVIYIEKYKKNTRIHLAPSAYGIYDITVEEDKSAPIIHLPVPLEETYEKLKEHGFGCPHTSYIINFCYLRTCTGKILKLAGVQGDFPIARSMVKAFNEQKERFLQAKYVRGEW